MGNRKPKVGEVWVRKDKPEAYYQYCQFINVGTDECVVMFSNEGGNTSGKIKLPWMNFDNYVLPHWSLPEGAAVKDILDKYGE